MKKLIALLLTLTLLLALAACGADEPKEDAKKQDTVAADAPTQSGEGEDSTEEAPVEITLENLMNHSESPEKDFQVSQEGVLEKYLGDAAMVVIPETVNGVKVTSVADKAFEDKSKLEAIRFADTIQRAGSQVFYGSSQNLKIALLGKGMRELEGTFDNCGVLEQVVLNEGLEIIGGNCFSSCYNLTTVEIPKSVKTINGAAFFCCLDLEQVTLPDGLTEISNQCFMGCDSLTQIHIPDSVTALGDMCFNGCESLTSIDIPETVTHIGHSAFEDCYELEQIVLPEGITEIGFECFSSCWVLTSIEIPKSVTEIGYGAFANTALTSIELPQGIQRIDYQCFLGCDRLTTIVIPDSVEEIDQTAFQSCSEELVIQSGAGSYAERYASENGIPFQAI